MSNISSVSSTPISYTPAPQAPKKASDSQPTASQAPTAASGPVDSDGDHDGSKPGKLDKTA